MQPIIPFSYRLLGSFSAATYGNNQFVAVGAGGRTARSSNGVQWTSSRTGQGSNLKDVAWGNGRYLAISDDATVFTSSEGATWSESFSAENNRLFSKLASNGSTFILIGTD